MGFPIIILITLILFGSVIYKMKTAPPEMLCIASFFIGWNMALIVLHYIQI